MRYLLIALLLVGCSSEVAPQYYDSDVVVMDDGGVDPIEPDAAPEPDAGITEDAGLVDAGTDPEPDAGTDAGTPEPDAGTDAGTEPDAGSDAGTPDAGCVEETILSACTRHFTAVCEASERQGLGLPGGTTTIPSCVNYMLGQDSYSFGYCSPTAGSPSLTGATTQCVDYVDRSVALYESLSAPTWAPSGRGDCGGWPMWVEVVWSFPDAIDSHGFRPSYDPTCFPGWT